MDDEDVAALGKLLNEQRLGLDEAAEWSPAPSQILMSIQRGDSYAIGETMARFDREIRRSVGLSQMGLLTDEQVIDDLQDSMARRIQKPDSWQGTPARERPYSANAITEGTAPAAKVFEASRVLLPSSFDERRAADLRQSKPAGARPIPLSDGGTDLIAFAPGSGHFLLEAFGATIAVLNAQPVVALLNALTLGGFIKSPLVRLKRFVNVRHSGDDLLRGASNNQGALEPVLGQPAQVVDFMKTLPSNAHLSQASVIREFRRDGTVRKEVWSAEFE